MTLQKAIKYLTKKDIIFSLVIEQYGVPEMPIRPPGFETLVLLILEQQVSIDSAKATFLKLKAAVTKLTPAKLFSFSNENFRACGISRQKTSYIKALASAVKNKEIDIDSFSFKSADIVREELIKIKGIGNWTIDVYLMFCLQSPDIIPLGDIAVVNTIKELFDINERSEMETYSKSWSPYRSVATFLLWHYYLGKRKRKIVY